MKKKILHVSCGGLGNGGVSTVIFSIVENLYTKYNFDCIVFKKKCNRESKFLKYGNLYRINCYNDNGKTNILEFIIRPFRMFIGIYRICKKNKYDIIHVHNNLEEGICLFAAKCAGVKTRIAHSHNTPSPKKENVINQFKMKMNIFLIRKFSTINVGCSDAACKYFYNNNYYKVIYNAVDLKQYKFENENKLINDNLTFIHVGRYCYQKNQEFLIKIFYEINKKIENTKLKLIGFGNDYYKLRKEVKELNLEDKVDFISGETADVSREYDSAQFMIFPSLYEGFGIALIEAQAKGIKCFVSEEAIQKEVDVGLLTFISLSKSEKEWADIILKNIYNNSKKDFSIIANNLIKFDIENIIAQYDMLYEEV